MTHKHSVRDTGAHFMIDPYSRQIKNDSVNKTTIVQYDHNSERLTFEMPLQIDGHAMTLCDLIEIHYINIATDGNSQNTGVYEVDDIKAEGEKAVFTWLIRQEATQLAGSLNFFIVFKCTENGKTVYRWGTEICKSLAVSAGMDNGEAALTEYPDILAQWKAELFEAGGNAVVNVNEAATNALAAIEEAGEAKKEAVLASIPDDYTALSVLADKNHRNKAGAIVLDAEGESIVFSDSSEYPLQGLKLFGKSTQDGTPTPDAPVEIVSVGASGKIRASVHGKNILPYPFIDTTKTVNGITFTDNGDGTITVNGTATGYADFTLYKNTDKPLCTEGFLHGCPVGGSNESFSLRVSDLVTKSGTDIGNGCGIYCEAKYIFIRVLTGTTVNNLTFAPMVNNGLLALPFEKGAEKQEIEIIRTLPGIPVTSGGNYTDANGQQWICDEIDLARGVYVRRIDTKTLIGKDREDWGMSHPGTFRCHSITTAFLCQQFESIVDEHIIGNHEANTMLIDGQCALRYGDTIDRAYFKWSSVTTLEEWTAWLSNNPIMIICANKPPTETPLSDSEIAAFKALHTNKPNTTILNDAGAHMAVEYVADTKLYIDNKIKEIMEGVTE